MTLDNVLEIFERDAASHTTGGPATEQELGSLEHTLGRPLPQSLRAFLSRLGPGLFYQGHEIFGPQRVMIHDIELVPSMTSILARLREQSLPDGLLPFHRGNGLIHLLDATEPGSGRVVSLPPEADYADLSAFLQAVVLPR
jgi:hypothetical protein